MFNNHNSSINFKIAKITVGILIALLTIACGEKTPWQSEILITDDRETLTFQIENLPPNPESCGFGIWKVNIDSGISESSVGTWRLFGDDCGTSYCETINIERGFRYDVQFSNYYPSGAGMIVSGSRWGNWHIEVPALQDDNGLIEEAIQTCEESLTCVVDPETSPCAIQAP